MDLQTFKSHFYSGTEFVHLNNSGQSLIPDVFKNVASQWLERFYREGAHCAMEGWHHTEGTRQKLAAFLGADPEEVAFFQTTAAALSQAAFGISLNQGDEILTWDQEYPSNFYPWRMAAERAGAHVIPVASKTERTDVQALLNRVTPRTRVIALSWIQYLAGAQTDLKFLSDQLKGSGIWLVADIIQGAGVKAFDFHSSGFDIICGGSHKFLCSGYGSGFMIVKKEKLSELQPLEYGAMTFGNPDTEKSFTLQPKKSALRFEAGSKSMIEVIAMGATLDLFTQIGIESIEKEAIRLSSKLRSGLRELGYQIHSPESHIVNFSPANSDHLNLVIEILEKGKVSFAKRGPGIRLSTHGFNHDEEIELTLNMLSDYKG